MRLILSILTLLFCNSLLSQFCNPIANFSSGRFTNSITYIDYKIEGSNQTWRYKVKKGTTEPSFIFYHNPCVNVIETGAIVNGRKVRKNLVNHTNVPDPLVGDYGWKLEFYSDTIYITTSDFYDIKPIFITMKYGRLITTDTICGPNCGLVNINQIELNYKDDMLILVGNSTHLFELEISKNGSDWNLLSYINCNIVYNPKLEPGIWYLRAKSELDLSEVIVININKKENRVLFDELGRVVNRESRSLSPLLTY